MTPRRTGRQRSDAFPQAIRHEITRHPRHSAATTPDRQPPTPNPFRNDQEDRVLCGEALALALAGDFIAGLIDAAMQADDPVEAVDTFFVPWRDRLVESDFRAGWPIVTVAVETNDDAPRLARSAAVFAR